MRELRHSFGPFVLDRQAGLMRDGSPVQLGQRALALLAALADADGAVVAKAALMERAWPGTFVEEGNLSVQIAALRRALGRTTDGGDWIVTVPRVGYRLLRPAAAQQYRPPDRPTLAVLPFSIGADAEQEYFADGVVEDIITALSRFRSFAVIARNSSFIYKGRAVDVRQVGRELGVRYVLEGSVRREGDRLRIGAQLVDAGNGAHLWAQRFDGRVGEVFDFQDRITEGVATVVEPRIRAAEIERSRRERPGSIAAYDIFLSALPGLMSESERGNASAYALFLEALRLEPDNATMLAYAAWALEHRITMGWPPLGEDDRAACVGFARRALENAAGDPAVMAHSGIALVQVGREYDWGMAVLSQAVEANPNHLPAVIAAGVGHLHCGSLDEALEMFDRAVRLSPRDPLAHIPLCGTAHVHMIRGDFEAALAWATRSLSVNANFDAAHWMLIAANAHLGRMDEARRHLARLVANVPGVSVTTIRDGQPARSPERLAAVLDGLRLAGLPEGPASSPGRSA